MVVLRYEALKFSHAEKTSFRWSSGSDREDKVQTNDSEMKQHSYFTSVMFRNEDNDGLCWYCMVQAFSH